MSYNFVNSRPGKTLYIKFYNGPIAKFFGKEQTAIVRPHDTHAVRIFGKKPIERVDIPDEPLTVEISRLSFKTQDEAIIDINIRITVAPILDREKKLVEIEHCVPAFTDNNPRDWIKNILKTLFDRLKQYNFHQIVWANMTPESVIQFESLIHDLMNPALDNFRNIDRLTGDINTDPENAILDLTPDVMKEESSSNAAEPLLDLSDVQAPIDADESIKVGEEKRLQRRAILSVTDADKVQFSKIITDIKSGNGVAKILEREAVALLEEFNFRVYPGSCVIDCQYPQIADQLDEQNIGHLPILKYINLFQNARERLVNQKQSFETLLQDLEREFEEQQQIITEETEELRIKHKLALEKQQSDYEFKKNKQKNYFQRQMEGENASFEAEKLLIDGDLAEAKAKAQIQMLDIEKGRATAAAGLHAEILESKKVEQQTEIEEMNLEKEKAQQMLSNQEAIEQQRISVDKQILNAKRQLPKPEELEQIGFSLDQLMELKTEQLNLKLKAVEDQRIEIDMARRHTEEEFQFQTEKWRHDLERAITNDQYQFQLTQKAVEQYLVFIYSRLSVEDRQTFIQSLGHHFAEALGNAKDMFGDVKVNYMPDGNGNGVFDFLSSIGKGLMQSDIFLPEIQNVLAGLGIGANADSLDAQKNGAESGAAANNSKKATASQAKRQPGGKESSAGSKKEGQQSANIDQSSKKQDISQTSDYPR